MLHITFYGDWRIGGGRGGGVIIVTKRTREEQVRRTSR